MSKPEEKLLNENEKVEEIFTNEKKDELFRPNGDSAFLQSHVEEERAKLKANFKKSKKFSNISILVAVAFIIACFVLVSQNNDALKITGYCLGGAALVGMLVYYVLTKNKFPTATREYMNTVETYFNAYAFHNEEYTDIYFDKSEKIEKADIASDMIYKDITRLASRNVIHAKFDKQNLIVSDLAVYHRGPKNQDLPTFVGKYFSLENNISFDGRIIIQLKSKEKEVDSPDYIDDLKKVKDDEGLVIYTTRGVDYKEVLGTKLISELKAHKIEGHLLNINIVVWGGHTAGYLSFDDATMVFPFENEYSAEPYIVYEKTQTGILKSLKVLNKAKEVKPLEEEEESIPTEEVKEEDAE